MTKKHYYKYILVFVLGLLLIGGSVYAAIKYSANIVIYDNSISLINGTNVQKAIDELANRDASTGLPIKTCQNLPSVNLGDWVSYTPPTTSYVTNKNLTGYTSTQTINPSELKKWRVIAINDDGSVTIISNYVTSVDVYFSGSVGYQNFSGYLNILARAYEDSGTLTKVGAGRHFGYGNQIEFCTGTLSTTTCPDDLGLLDDINLIKSSNVLGTTIAYRVNATSTATIYWASSRVSDEESNSFYGRDIYTSGVSTGDSLVSNGTNKSSACALRPIITLKAGLSYSGAGTSANPWVPSA